MSVSNNVEDCEFQTVFRKASLLAIIRKCRSDANFQILKNFIVITEIIFVPCGSIQARRSGTSFVRNACRRDFSTFLMDFCGAEDSFATVPLNRKLDCLIEKSVAFLSNQSLSKVFFSTSTDV